MFKRQSTETLMPGLKSPWSPATFSLEIHRNLSSQELMHSGKWVKMLKELGFIPGRASSDRVQGPKGPGRAD